MMYSFFSTVLRPVTILPAHFGVPSFFCVLPMALRSPAVSQSIVIVDFLFYLVLSVTVTTPNTMMTF